MFGWGVQSPTPGSPEYEKSSGMYTGSMPQGSDEIAGLTMKVQRLQDQISGLTNYGTSFSSLNNDVQQVVDRIGRELSAQRRSLDEVTSKMEGFKREVESIKAGKVFDQLFVSQTRFAEVYAELKLELKTMSVQSTQMAQQARANQNGNFSMAAVGQSLSQAMTNAYAGNSMMTNQGTAADTLAIQRNVDGMKHDVASVGAKVQDMSGRMNEMSAKVQDFNRNIQQCFGYLQDCSVKIQETNAKVFDVKLEFTGQLSEIAQRIGMPQSAMVPSGPPAVVGVPPQEFERAINALEEKLTAVRMGQMGNEGRLHEVAVRSQVNNDMMSSSVLPHDVVSAKIKEATDALYQSIGSTDIVRTDMLRRTITEVREEFQRRFHEVVREFKNDNAILNDCLEQNALKTAYLAIAATECTQEEKVQLFNSIKSKEREIAEKTGGEPGLAKIAPHYPTSLSNIRSSVEDLMPNVMQLSAPTIHTAQPGMQMMPPPVGAFNPTNNISAVTDTLYIDRRPGKIGLSLDGSSGNFLLVQRVNEGLINTWNGENPSQALRPGDRILAINGIARDPNGMIEETKRTEIPILTLTVERGSGMLPQGTMQMQLATTVASGMYSSPTQMSQLEPQLLNIKVFCMADEKLGLSLDCDDNKTLLVTDVKRGPVLQWNNNNPHQSVRPGDRILAVNGKGGSPQVLLEETGKGGNLDIQFLLAPAVAQ